MSRSRRSATAKSRWRGRCLPTPSSRCRKGLPLRRRSSAGDVQPALPRNEPPVAELIKPGMKWIDMLRESVRRGMYADAIGREDAMAQRSHPEPHEVPEPLRGRSRQRHMAFRIHASDRSRRLRGDASRHQRAQEGRGRRTRGDCAAAAGARRLPCTHAHVVDRRGDAVSQPRQQRSSMAIARRSRTTTSIRATGRRCRRRCCEHGRIDDFRVRQYDADDGIFWASLSARLIDFQGRQVIVSNTTNISDMIARPGADPASKRRG